MLIQVEVEPIKAFRKKDIANFMASNLIYDKSNWLYPDPQKNQVHDITVDDINYQP